MASTGNRMEFGFGVFPYSYVSFAETAELARLGDDLGYDAITLPEHLLTPNWPQAPISRCLRLRVGVRQQCDWVTGIPSGCWPQPNPTSWSPNAFSG